MKTLLLAPALLLLATCAPAQIPLGRQALSPRVMPSPFAPLTVQPGETVYVQYTYPRDLLKLNDQPFRDLKIDFANVGGQNVWSVEAHAGWLSMTPRDLPAGVALVLVSASVVKEVVGTTHTRRVTQVRSLEQVRVTLRASAEKTALLGLSGPVALVYFDQTGENEVPLLIRVGAEEDRPQPSDPWPGGTLTTS